MVPAIGRNSSSMTAETPVDCRAGARATEVRIICERQRRAFRQPFLFPAAAAGVPVRARRLRRELHRTRPGDCRLQHRLGDLPDAGRNSRRPHRPLHRAGRRTRARSGRVRRSSASSIRTGSWSRCSRVAGLANTVFHPADYALLSHHVAKERVGRRSRFHTFSGMLGSAVAPASVLLLRHAHRLARRLHRLGDRRAPIVAVLLVMQRDDYADSPHFAPKPAAAGDDSAERRLAAADVGADPAQLRVLHRCSRRSAVGIQNYSVVALDALFDTPPVIGNTALTGHLLLTRDRRARRRIDRQPLAQPRRCSPRLASSSAASTILWSGLVDFGTP